MIGEFAGQLQLLGKLAIGGDIATILADIERRAIVIAGQKVMIPPGR